MNHTRMYSAIAIAMAQAVTVVPAAKAQLEEVIVTAERREASLQDTEISMSVFSTRSIEEQGIQTYLDLSAMAPNVMMHEMPGKAGGAISIRGFKNAETFSTFEPKVALYLDGVLIAKGAGSVFDVLDLERVEILRGPQGTLYGRNTVGGAVNFITKKPNTEEFSGKVSASLGDYDLQDFKGSVNIPIGDTLAFKASAGSMKRDGFWENRLQNNKTLGDRDRQSALLQLMWEPTDSLNFLYAYDKTDIDEGFYPSATVNYGPLAPQLAPYVQDGTKDRYFDGFDTFTKADISGHAFTVNWELNDNLSLVSVTGYREFQVDSFQDSDATPILQGHVYSGDDYQNLTEELRLVGDGFNSKLEYVLGAFYMDEDIKDSYQNLESAAYGLSINSGASAKNEVWAVFGQGTYSLSEKMDFTFGLRYTQEDRSMSNRQILEVLGGGPVVSESINPNAQKDYDDLSGTLSLSYDWSHDLMTYFKVSKGYSSGGFNARQADPQYFYPGYDEETVYTYELGWKSTWLDSRLILNGALFYSDYSDLQVNQLTETGSNNIDNAGDAEITGLELEATAMVTDSFEVGGGYGYLDPQYKKYIAVDGTDLSNNHWAHAPKNTFNLYGRYQVEDVFGGNLVMRVDYSWVDDYFLLTANGPNLVDGNVAPSYDTINARIALEELPLWGDTHITVAAWGKNLTDELWYNSGFDLSDGLLGYVGKSPSAPRTWGVDLIWEF
ncbi:TonB-dependent receptor [Haliea sp. E17]|uniref:TonB-dependent receptor n=1 Tax=Haliea sp. E17 TaxID=3401576 RepID=UPI003AAD1351